MASQINIDGSNTLAAPGVTPQTTPGAFTATGGSAAPIAAPTTTFDASLINQNQANGGTTPTFPPSPNSATPASSSISANTSIPNPIPSAENIIDNGSQATPAEAKNTSLLNRVAQMIGMGKTQESLTQSAENAAGVSGLTKIVNSLNTQLQGLNDQATALANDASAGGAIQNQEQQDILKNGNITTTAGLAPKTAGDLRMNQIKQSAVASQALTVKSALYGAQGNLSLAKDAADKAATAQYADQQHQLDYMKALIDANTPTMTKQEKAQAAIVQAQLADRQTQIDNAKEDKKTILAMAATALKNNPNDPAAQFAAQEALAESNQQQPDLQKVLGLVGKYQQDPIATQQAILNLAKTRAEISKLNKEAQAAGVPAITNPQASQYAGALSIVLGSANFTAQQKQSIVQAVNNGQDPAAVIKNQAKNIMGSNEATTVTKYETAQSSLKDIQQNLKDFYSFGGNTDIFSGNYEKVINKLGAVNNPKLVDLATQIQANLQIYRNAVSGTAYSAQEGADIASIFPGINKTEGLNNAILAGRMKAFDSTIDGAYRSALGSTYDQVKSASQPASDPAVAKFDKYSDSINPAPNGKDAYIPRSVWSTVDDKDGLLAAVKKLGYNLLVQ